MAAPEACDTPGLEEYEGDIIGMSVAQKLNSARGDTAGGMARWARDVVQPKIDPRTAFLKYVRAAVEQTSGQGEYTFRRPNRRNPRPDVALPSAYQPIPRITVIVDTSGSMSDSELGLAVGLVGKVLNSFRIRDGINVIAGDVGAACCRKVFDPRKVVLAGGGGTDMGKIILQAADAKPAPQLIVVVTDGDTPWCEPISIPVVACITQEYAMRNVPAWIKPILQTSF